MNLTFGFLATLLLSLSISTSMAEEQKLEDQILEILSSDRGTVRKWVYEPKITVLFEGRSFEPFIRDLIERIDQETVSLRAPLQVEFFDLGQVKNRLAGNTAVRNLEGQQGDHPAGRSGVMFDISSNPTLVRGDIFLVLAEHETAILFGALTLTGPSLQRSFSENSESCYFDLYSRDDQLRSAFIFIDSTNRTEGVEGCIYEELMQTFGLLNDAVGSQIFTFNNVAGIQDSDAADMQLLRSLYDDTIHPGDTPRDVANIYLQQLNVPISQK